jgi:serine phosphatase RsbU (regulator of sigma subunit)
VLRHLTKVLKGDKHTESSKGLSLRALLTWTTVISVMTASLIAGYYAYTLLYKNKLNDTWAIMFLELEQQGNTFFENLTNLKKSKANSDEDIGELLIDDVGNIEVLRGPFGTDLDLSDFNITDEKSLTEMPQISVFHHAGESYLVLSSEVNGTKNRLKLRKVPQKILKISPAPPTSEGLLYLLTREGRVLYTSDSKITELNVTDRPLVQKFISAPISQGQLEFEGDENRSLYGFFSEIPNSNIIMFSEVYQSTAMAPVKKIVIQFLSVLGLILLGVVVLIQLPLSKIIEPVRDLVQMAKMVGQGKFDVKPRHAGFGELSVLNSAFTAMAKGLVDRDQKVSSLMLEQVEKVRLEKELDIARRIQENLLPLIALPKEAKVEIAAEYIAAAECAGDWYHYYYDPKNEETVVVVADVSGHGAGSSMFTAVIAGLFDDARNNALEAFDMVSFAKRVNDVLFRLGRQQWHASMVMLKFSTRKDGLEILLAGHPPPLINSGPKVALDVPKPLFTGSPLLGTSLEFEPLVKNVKFPSGSSVMVYTDGLTEALNPKGKAFSRRRAHTCFVEGSKKPQENLAHLLQNWRDHISEQQLIDDVCVVTLSAS